MNGHVAKLAFFKKKAEMRLDLWRFLIRLFTENPAFVPQSRPDHFGSQQTPQPGVEPIQRRLALRPQPRCPLGLRGYRLHQRVSSRGESLSSSFPLPVLHNCTAGVVFTYHTGT